jgi:hypothetical protein
MRDDRLARKDGAGFFGLIANGNDDVERGILELIL